MGSIVPPSGPVDAQRNAAVLRFQRDVLSCGGEYHQLLHCILHCASELSHADGACVEMTDGGEIVYEAAIGIAKPFVGLRMPISASLSGRCVQENALMRCDDAESDPRVDLPACRKIGLRSMLIVPLPYDQKTLGVLKVMSARAHAFTPADEEALLLVSGFIGATIGRKHAETALREFGEYFRTLADNIAQLAWRTDSVGNILWYNKRWYDYTGTTLEQMREQGWSIVHDPEHFPRVYEKWMASITSGEPWEDTFPLKGADGKYRWFLSRAVPIRDEHNHVVQWFGTNTDITAQRDAEESLRRAKEVAEAASQAKDEFIAALSHELRTPLSPVLLVVEELLDDNRLPEDIRERLDAVRRNVALEARLIDDLLDIARIAQGKLMMHLSTCNAHELLDHAIEIVEPERDAKEMRLIRHYDARDFWIHADFARMQQVFWNVLKNAIKFTDPRGEIVVRTYNPDGRTLAVAISDNGRGFEPELHEAIFAPFEQAGLANDHRFGGLGLGLAICRAVMKLHGGTIAASSDGPGAGATFSIRIATVPVSTLADEPASGPGSALAIQRPHWSVSAKGERLLLVEDHKPTLAVLERLLARKGYQVTSTTSCEEALKAAASNRVDVLVSDIGLPDGSGYELLPRIRELHPDVHAVALTGYGAEEDRAKSSNAGFAIHLTKPVDFGELQRALLPGSNPVIG